MFEPIDIRQLPADRYGWYMRFIAHLDYGETADDCILWNDESAHDEAGYGVARDWNGKVRRTHIIVYELFTGVPVPEDEVVDHRCRIHPCCNFFHLQAKSRKENTLIDVGPTAKNALKTQCPKGHPYDEENTQWHSGRRECKKCIRARQKARRQAAREEKQEQEEQEYWEQMPWE